MPGAVSVPGDRLPEHALDFRARDVPEGLEDRLVERADGERLLRGRHRCAVLPQRTEPAVLEKDRGDGAGAVAQPRSREEVELPPDFERLRRPRRDAVDGPLPKEVENAVPGVPGPEDLRAARDRVPEGGARRSRPRRCAWSSCRRPSRLSRISSGAGGAGRSRSRPPLTALGVLRCANPVRCGSRVADGGPRIPREAASPPPEKAEDSGGGKNKVKFPGSVPASRSGGEP